MILFNSIIRVSLKPVLKQSYGCMRYSTATATKPLRILFFGTDEFASTHLKALVKEKNRPNSCVGSIDLVCPPDRFTGRKLNILSPSPTKGIAELYNIPVQHTPEKAKSLDDWNINSEVPYDLGVVVSFGYFIPPHIISAFKYGGINVHPSLLPKFRGAAPIQHTILQGESETGVTVQELDDKKFDAGRILAQTTVDLSAEEYPRYKELSRYLADVGSQLLINTIRNFEACKRNAKEQDITQATQAPKIKKEWSEINFDQMASWQVEQLHRAIGEQYPLRTKFTFSRIKRSLLVKQKVFEMQLFHIHLPDDSPFYRDLEGVYPPGTFMLDDRTGSLHIICADGLVIGATHIQAESKSTIKAKDFINGYEIRRTGRFGIEVDPSTVAPGQSGVRQNKRRQFYEKTIRKRLGLRRETYERLYKNKNY